MHIVVTGASGFLGSRLIRRMSSAGLRGTAISRRRVGSLPIAWSWIQRDAVLNSSLPACNPSSYEWLVHLEVKQHVSRPTEKDRAEFENVNVGGTRQWLDWCDRHGIKRFAYVSTIKALGESLSIQDETSTREPSTLYGQSKRRAEGVVSAWAHAASDRTALILRPAVIYGPNNTANMYAMVKAIDLGMFFFAGANRNVKSLVSVENVAAAVVHLLSRARRGVAVYNIIDRQSYSVREIGCMMARTLGKRRMPPTVPLSIATAAATIGDVISKVSGRDMPLTRQRLAALTESTHFSSQKLVESGFTHPQSTEDGLAEMIAWYRESKHAVS